MADDKAQPDEPVMEFTEGQMMRALELAAGAGLANIPTSVVTFVGQQVISNIMAQDQIAGLRRQVEVMATDMGVLQARLQEAGVQDGEDTPHPH